MAELAFGVMAIVASARVEAGVQLTLTSCQAPLAATSVRSLSALPGMPKERPRVRPAVPRIQAVAV